MSLRKIEEKRVSPKIGHNSTPSDLRYGISYAVTAGSTIVSGTKPAQGILRTQTIRLQWLQLDR